MKPHQTLSILLVILLLLLLPTLFVSDGGNSRIRYPSFSRIASTFGIKYDAPVKNVTISYNQPQKIETKDTTKIKLDSVEFAGNDTTRIDSTVIAEVPQPQKVEIPNINTKKIVPIEYGSNAQALNSFFESLKTKEYKKRPIRVLHFADSQTEGDMITSSIRETLQEQFGGHGVGFLQAHTRLPQPVGVNQQNSDAWIFNSVKTDDFEANSYGILGGLSKFDDGSDGEYIEFSKPKKLNRNSKYKKLRICLGANTMPYLVRQYIDELPTDSVIVEPNNEFNMFFLNVPENVNSTKIEFVGEKSLLVYGISQESEHGIFVDNIPVRGSSGVFFSKFDTNFASRFLHEINSKLIIVQYGINVVPGEETDYKYYENAMTSQLRAIKSLNSNVSIILIGVSDMSQNSINGYQSNPNVVKVLDAQRRAAKRAGVAFWDCYKAMGGDNSMAAWAMAKPALAQKDFTHFNKRGARVIAKLFTNSLLHDYHKYLEHN